MLSRVGLYIIKRKDLKEKIRSKIADYFSNIEFKNQMSKIDPEFSEIPEILAVENILRATFNANDRNEVVTS